MPNPENLEKGKATQFQSGEKAVINGRKGGIASGESKRKTKSLRAAFEELLSKEFTDKKGNKLSGAEAIALKQFEKALNGDPRAFEICRDTSGQKPVDKLMIAEVDQNIIDEVEAAVMEESLDDNGQETSD